MSSKFTFYAEGDKIEVRVVEFEHRLLHNQTDAVWLDSTITVEAGAFIGSFKASFTTHDLLSLHHQLKNALTTLTGTILCQNTGGGISLAIKLDNGGKAVITGVAQPNRLRRGTLNFRIDTDHFALIRTFRELEGTMRAFPPGQAIKSKGQA